MSDNRGSKEISHIGKCPKSLARQYFFSQYKDKRVVKLRAYFIHLEEKGRWVFPNRLQPFPPGRKGEWINTGGNIHSTVQEGTWI